MASHPISSPGARLIRVNWAWSPVCTRAFLGSWGSTMFVEDCHPDVQSRLAGMARRPSADKTTGAGSPTFPFGFVG